MFDTEKNVYSDPKVHSKLAAHNSPTTRSKSTLRDSSKTHSKSTFHSSAPTHSKQKPHSSSTTYSKPTLHGNSMIRSKPKPHSSPTAHNTPTLQNSSTARTSATDRKKQTTHNKPTINIIPATQSKPTAHSSPQHMQPQPQQEEQRTYNEKNHNNGWARIPLRQQKTARQTPFAGKKQKILIMSSSIAVTLAFCACVVTVIIFGGFPEEKYGISINGQADLILADKTEAQDVLDELTEYYTDLANNNEDVVNVSSVTYEEDVQVIKTKISSPEIKNKDEAKQVLIEGHHINVIIEGVCKDTEDIDYPTETKQDDTIPLGTTKTQQEGEKGSKDITYDFTLKNGEYIEKTVLEETVVKDPVPEIILEGKKPAVASVTDPSLGKSDMEMLEHIIKRESGGNIHATNGKYKGIGQLQESHYQTYVGMSYAETLQQPDPYAVQLEAMLGYINGRYGSVQAAYNFRAKNGWY